MKREVLENLQQDSDSRMIIWLANMPGKPVGFECKNSLWIQNAHKTSPMSFHVDVVCFQKISRPPPQRELEIRRARGLIGPRNSSGVGVWRLKFTFRGHVQQLFLTDFCELFWCFCWSCCVFPTMLRLKMAFLFHKSFFLSKLAATKDKDFWSFVTS